MISGTVGLCLPTYQLRQMGDARKLVKRQKREGRRVEKRQFKLEGRGVR